MQRSVWVNLSSQDLTKARAFYENIPGFEINTERTNDSMLGLFVGKNRMTVNIFKESMFSGFIGSAVTNAKKSNEVLFSLGANSREEVDISAQKVKAAGGEIYANPEMKDGWMYGFGFCDPDGHRWNVLYMDMDKFSG